MEVLAAGGTALDAVIAAVRVVEDDPACNAGTGAVLTSRGTLELDACVMDGASLASGAVAVLPPFRHPIDIARAVLEDGRYHLLAGDGAAAFARARGFEPMRSGAHDHAGPARRVRGPRDLRPRQHRRRGGARRQRQPRGGDEHRRDVRDRSRAASATCRSSAAGRTPTSTPPARARATERRSRERARRSGRSRTSPRARRRSPSVPCARVLKRYGGYGGLILLDKAGDVGIARSASAMPHAIARSDGSVIDGE